MRVGSPSPATAFAFELQGSIWSPSVSHFYPDDIPQQDFASSSQRSERQETKMQLKHLNQKELARRWNISHRTFFLQNRRCADLARVTASPEHERETEITHGPQRSLYQVAG